MEEKKAIIEALIFAAEIPLSVERIAEIMTGTEKAVISEALQELVREYIERNGGIQIHAVAGGYQFRTRADLGAWVKKMRTAKPPGLTPAALETLAIIAYRQPVVKADVDRFRGVDAAGSIRRLLEKKLVRIVGRKDVPGRPILYGTTRKFLEVFNLQDLSALPTLRELKELQE
ncbi:MAG: SMC-Scp complex subunit ScpB [Syntrophales bacterium]|nr:SMC-Scp complex subunit ScpB [Syntrophales bacterium]